MVIPCIDLMGRKVVQLVQGNPKNKALELPDALTVLDKFRDFPEIQVIDLDAAMGRTGQSDIVQELCARKPCRVGGGIRNSERAREAVDCGAHKVIVGSAAFNSQGINQEFLRSLASAVPREKLMIAVDCLGDRVAIRGWSEVLPLTSSEVLPQLEPYCSEFLCTCIDVEGKLQGTNLDWFRKLRTATNFPITAAGGITTEVEISALEAMGMHAALGMSIYRRFFPELFA
ncbi:MAG TPA: HisA/HisF-related TIM barrel protein [Terriglobia bacterium]|nr:HisA/HisF-related TIM barrel protein [Terriglobia bacterium]